MIKVDSHNVMPYVQFYNPSRGDLVIEEYSKEVIPYILANAPIFGLKAVVMTR
jgi:hypothetical protein